MLLVSRPAIGQFVLFSVMSFVWIGATLCVAILPIVLMRGKRVPRLLDFASVVAPAHGSCSSLITVWIFVGVAFDFAGEGTA